MTSYNRVNGIYAPESYDACTKVLRNEWGFQGLVMTDWLSTSNNMASAVACIESGNDLIMPGQPADLNQLIQAAQGGQLDLEKLKDCAVNVIDIVLKSNRYDDAQPYTYFQLADGPASVIQNPADLSNNE